MKTNPKQCDHFKECDCDKPDQTTITINPDGTMKCLHTDIIPLQTLGELKVTRASTVEFDEESQRWEAWAKGRLLYHNQSRKACLDWEQENYETFT